MSMKKVWVGLVLLMGMPALAASHSNRAAVERKAETSESAFQNVYIAGMLGVSSVSSQINTGPGYGLQAAYYFANPVGAGLFIQGGNHSKGVSSFLFGAQGLVHLHALLDGLQIGALLGLEKFSAGGISGTSSLAYGGKVAYDYKVSRNYPISLGVDVSYILTSKTDETRNISNSFAILTPLATAKFWF